MDPAILNTRKIGQAFNAEQIMAATKLLIQSAGHVRDMARAADALAYAEAKARHQMIQEHVAGITAEAGRALQIFQAFRRLPGYDDMKALGRFLEEADHGRTLNQLEREMRLAQSLQTPQQVSQFVENGRAESFKRMMLQYYINNLISGPLTHARYAAGNAITALWRPLIEKPIAATIGAISGDEGRVRFGEIGAELYGFVKGSRDGLRAAATAFQTGVSPPLPGERHMSIQFLETQNAIPGLVGKFINVPSRSVSAIHSFFKSLRYEQNTQALAYRTAVNEGLSGEAFNARVAELTQMPTAEMMEAATPEERLDTSTPTGVAASATTDALKELYMAPADYSSFMGKLASATNSSLVAKIIVPFMKIGTQITRQAFVEHSPIGLMVSKEVRENFMGRNGTAAQQMQMAKITAGTALVGAMVLATSEGLATGDGPTDPRERDVWLLNHRPNHLTIGPISIPYAGLGYLGMLMRFSANMYETAHGWDDKEKTSTDMVVAFLEGITRSVLDDTWMRGAKDALDAMYHPDEYGGSFVRGFVTNWLPYSIGAGQVARVVDPFARRAETPFDTVKRQIPWVSTSLFPKRDVFGTPIPSSGPLPDYANDPTVKALEDLKVGISRPEEKIRGVKLTEQQYDDYTRIAGRYTKMRLDALTRGPAWGSVPAEIRVEMVKKAVETSRETARTQVMMQSVGTPNDIVAQAVKAKLTALGVK